MKQQIFFKGLHGDHSREQAFKTAYGLDVEIGFTSFFDAQGNNVRFTCEFTDALGNKYTLDEFYKDGADNTTALVNLDFIGEEEEILVKQYSSYLDAEIALANLIKKRIVDKDFRKNLTELVDKGLENRPVI